MDASLVSLVTAVVSALTTTVTAIAGLVGGWFALVAAWNGWERAQGYSDVSMRQIGTEVLVASVLLGIVGLFKATGGIAFGTTSYSAVQFATSGLTPQAAAAANASLGAGFTLAAAMGRAAQLWGVLLGRELGRGRSEVSIYRVFGLLMGGAVLADLPHGILALNSTLGTNLFTGS